MAIPLQALDDRPVESFGLRQDFFGRPRPLSNDARANSNSESMKLATTGGSGAAPSSRVASLRRMRSETSLLNAAGGSHSAISVGKCIGAIASIGCTRSQRKVAAGRRA
jgi:hypothetical protein